MGITLKLRNLVSPQLAILSREFEKLDQIALALSKTLGKIDVDSKALRSLTTAANSTNRAFERANLSAAQLHQHLHGIQATAGAMGAAGLLGRAGGGGGGHGGGRSPAGGIHGGNLHVGTGGVGLGAAAFGLGDWFWPLAASGAAVYGGKALYESAKELNTEQNRFRLFGMTEGQNQEAFRFARDNSVYGTTQAERLSALREAQGVFRESGLSGSDALAGSKLAGPLLAKLDFLASSLDDESAAKLHSANLSMLRYVESSGGLKSPQEFNRIAEFGYKLNVSSGGTVNWEQLRQLKARAGAAGFHLSDDALARLEPVIAELKGGSVGFGLSTAYNRLTGATRVPNQVAHELVQSGIWDANAIAFNKEGGIKQFLTPGGPLSKDKIDLLNTNPELFYEKYIKPMYDRMKLDAAEIARQNVMIFGTTGGRNMTLVDNQIENIHRSVQALQKTMGIDAATKAAKGSLSGQEQEFDAAWTDFKTNFGTKMLPFFTGILKAGAAILRFVPTVPVDGVPKAAVSVLQHGFFGAIGDWAGHALANSTTAKGSMNHFAGKGGTGLTVHTQVNIDGRKVADAVSKTQAQGLAAPQTGINLFDSSQMLAPAGGF